MTDAVSVAPINPGSIRWDDRASLVERRCPVCSNAGPHVPLLEVPALVSPHQSLKLIRCAGCASAFYDPPDIRDFSDLGQQGDGFWRFYLDVGGGLWETIWPLRAVANPSARTLLDVGCGFGFALDFWRSEVGPAEGVELAAYGRIGADMLGVTIHSETIEDCTQLAGRTFDVAYASEVIEHVPDPHAFAALLARLVADDGMLIMTTPCASYVARANESPTLLAALAPGFHGFLLSPQAFADTARRAGFAFVDVRCYNERMVLWASRKPLAGTPAPESVRPAYFRYMAQRYALPDDATPLWQGFAYRYLRDAVNTGQWSVAKDIAARLVRALERSHGVDLRDTPRLGDRAAVADPFDGASQAGPFFLPCLYYFLGCVAHHVDRDAARAERFYAGAAEAIVACSRIAPILYLEAASLLWPARRAAAQMQLARGETAKALQSLIELADTAREASAANAYTAAPDGFIDATLTPIIDRLRTRGQSHAAAGLIAARDRHAGGVASPARTPASPSRPIHSFETSYTIKTESR